MAKALTFIALILLFALSVHGQPDSRSEKSTPSPPYVAKINFRGNTSISEEELRLIISTSEKRSFLGLGLFGGAQKPFNSEEFAKDIFLIKKLYTYKGFFFTDVDTTIVRKKNGKKVNLNILIHEHEPSKVDALHYEGLERIPSELKTTYLSQQRLKLNDVFDLLEKINNRDDIIDLYLKVSSKFYPRLVLFTVQKNNLKIWRETGFGLAKNQLKSFSLPLDLIPHFREVFENQTSFIGELGFGEGTKYFFNTFFFGKPKSSLLIPVVIQGKVGCIIYADNGRGTELNQGRSVTILEHLSTNVGLALGRVILEQKQKQTLG